MNGSASAGPTALIVDEWPNPDDPRATIVRVRCPHCAGIHSHGLPDGHSLGHRTPDCWAGPDYRLVRARELEPVA